MNYRMNILNESVKNRVEFLRYIKNGQFTTYDIEKLL